MTVPESLLVGLIKAVASYGLRRVLSDRRRLLEAGDRFRKAFVECKLKLDTTSDDPFKIIQPYLKQQELAVAEYAPYLREKVRKQFLDAWHSYYCRSPTERVPFPEKYFAAGNLTKANNERKKASKRIARLLSHAPIF